MKKHIGLLGSMLLGVALMTAAPALAAQITICQSCTTAPGGDPNLITDPSSFNMFLQGASSTGVAPTLIVIAEYNGGGAAPTVTVNGGAALSLATVGVLGSTANTVAGWTGTPSTVFDALGIGEAGGSVSFVNMNGALVANGFAAATSFTVYAFQYNGGMSNTPLTVGVTGADAGSFIAGFGCQVTTALGSACTPNGNVNASVFTNSGLITRVPEPASLLLLGAGLAGIGVWRRKSAKV